MSRWIWFIFSFIWLEVSAQQKEGSNWLFGYGARVGFASGLPVADTNSNQRSTFGCGTISDAQGNLLFYTNGSTVWNRNHQVMPNGTGLLEADSNKAVLIQKKPGSESIYYIFVATNPHPLDLSTGRLFYTVVDMELQNGLGDVLPMMKNIRLGPRIARMVAAARHQNNRDFWILTHGYGYGLNIPGVIEPMRFDSSYYAFKLTDLGLDPIPVRSIVGFGYELVDAFSDYDGFMRTSPNSDKIAWSTRNTGLTYTKIVDFNRSTGTVSAFFSRSGFGFGKGCFSPDSKFYFIANAGGIIYSLDLSLPTSQQIEASTRVTVGELYEPLVTDLRPRVTDVQLGLDGKIYVNPYPGATFLSRINNPCKRFGPDIGWEPYAVDLKGRKCGLEFPVHNQTLFVNVDKLQAQAARDTICQGDSVEILAYGAGAERFTWFRNSETTVLDTGGILKVAPAVNTVYRVRGTGICAGVKDTSIQIVVVPRPVISMGADTQACGAKTFTYTYPSQNNYRYLWKSNIGTGNFTTKGYLQVAVFDRDTAWNGKIKLTLSNPGCSVSDSISVRVNPTPKSKPILSPSPDTSICQGQYAVLAASSLNNLKWRWSTGDSSQSILVSAPGNFTCRFISQEGCLSDSFSTVQVIVNPLPTTQTLSILKRDSTLCFPAQIQLGINPEPNISYSWQGPTDSLSNSQISNPSFAFQNQDTLVKTIGYKLSTLNTETGCRNNDSITLKVVPFLRPDSGPDKSYCAENQQMLGLPGVSNFAYQWSPAVGLQTPQSAQTRTSLENPSFENILNQRFVRTVSLLGCQSSDTVEVQIYPKVPKPQLAGPQFVCPGVQQVPYQFSTHPVLLNDSLFTFHCQVSGGDSVGRIRINWKEENPNGGIQLKLGNRFGCQPDSVFLPVNITRNLRPQTQVVPGLNDSICLASAQSIAYQILPFNLQSRYQWRFSPDLVQFSFPSADLLLSTFNSPGLYNLTLSESDTTPIAQCFGKAEYQIRIWPQPIAKTLLGKDSLCHLSSEPFTVDDEQQSSQYNWTSSKGAIENTSPNGGKASYMADFDQQTDFTSIELSCVETSEKGCVGPANTKVVVVESIPAPKILVPNENLEWNSLENRSYEAIGRPGSAFTWEAENGTISSGQGSSQVRISWLPEQLRYRLKVQEITRIGCLGESEFQTVPYDSALFIPNLVTPNGDRKNDQLEIKNLHFYPDNQLTIFDRWGKKVFEAGPYRQDWPNQRLSNGLYFFSFSAGGQVLKGWLMVAE